MAAAAVAPIIEISILPIDEAAPTQPETATFSVG